MFGKKKEKEPAQTAVAKPTPRPTPPPARPTPPPALKPSPPVRQATNTCTLISNLEFEGKLTFSGTVTIDCKFKGSVVTEEHLVIGPSATVEGEISAGTIEIAGKIKGDITAAESVNILSGGEVRGNIITPSIAMEKGVVFEGQCSRPESARLAKQKPMVALKT